MSSGKVTSSLPTSAHRVTALNLRWPKAIHVGISGLLDIPKGIICGLMGPSGSGKSTILKAIAGWDRRLEGRLDLEYWGVAEGKSGDVVLLPQESLDLILPWYRAEHNLLLAAKLSGIPSQRDLVRRFAQTLGLLPERLTCFPKQLSGGERRRLALGMVLLHRARLLLLDEPFTGLDFDLRTRIWDLVHNAVKASAELPVQVSVQSILMVSHDVKEVSVLCDRTYMLAVQDGKITISRSTERAGDLHEILPSVLFYEEKQDRTQLETYESELKTLTKAATVES